MSMPTGLTSLCVSTCGWVDRGGQWVPLSLNTLCVIGVLFSNYSLNKKACGTTLYEKVSHRWV